METGFMVSGRKTAAVILMALAAALCAARESPAAESARVQRMRVDAVRELRPLKRSLARLKVRASHMAIRVAKMRIGVPSSVAREFRIIEGELRLVARTGSLSRMERKIIGYNRRPPQEYRRREQRPPRRGDRNRHDDGYRRSHNERRRDHDRREHRRDDGPRRDRERRVPRHW